MTVVEEVQAHVLALEADELDALLRRMEPEDRAGVRTWFTGARKWFTTASEGMFARMPDKTYRDWAGSVEWMQTSCAVALCPPVEAVRMVPWQDFWDHQNPPARELATTLLCDAPKAWATSFLPAASRVQLGTRGTSNAQGSVTEFIRRGVLHHELPCPEGPAFLHGQLSSRAKHADRLLEQLRHDPLMPDLVHHTISAGLVGNAAALPPVVPILLHEGLLDRDRLRDTCLLTLTADTRVSSQRVVSALLDTIDLRADEIEGGLDFLLSVMATRHGSVATVLLPRALELVRSGHDLVQVAGLLGGRSEKALKQAFVRALRTQDLRTRASTVGVLAAVDVLAEGEDDAALIDSLSTLAAELGATDAPAVTEEPPPSPTGLWEATPEPSLEREWPYWSGYQQHPTLSAFLNRRSRLYDMSLEYAVHRLLSNLRDNPHSAEGISATVAGLFRSGSLSLTRFVALTEPVFLGGGLRLIWPQAIAVAENIAGAGRSMSGFPELLRTLTRYAPEVPGAGTLPPNLLGLAAATGRSKSTLEARALGAALAHTNVKAYVASLTAPRARPERSAVGLWNLHPPAPVLPLLLDPSHPHYRQDWLPQTLAYLSLDVSMNSRWSNPSDATGNDVSFVRLAARAVQSAGLDQTRTRLAAASRNRPAAGPLGRAAAMWVDGALTPHSFDDVLNHDRGLGPLTMEHVVFMWTAEQLVRLPWHPGTLSDPSRRDGTLDADAVVDRLCAFDGTAQVGPIDLLLTLLRLRPVPADERETLLAKLHEVSVCTDPKVSAARSGDASFDVVPVLREWVRHGPATFDWSRYSRLDRRILDAPASHPDILVRVMPSHPSLRSDLPENPPGYREPRVHLVDGRLETGQLRNMLLSLVSEGSQRDGVRQWLVDLAQHDGVLAPECLTEAATGLLDIGHLPLTRWTESLQWLFDHGALRVFWDPAVALAAHACEAEPKPNGLAYLLTALAATSVEVPDPHIPAAIGDLAASRGSTKSHLAARSLLSAVEAP